MIASGSSGIQEAINDGCGASISYYYLNTSCRINIPPSSTPYPVGRLFVHADNTILSGYGATLACKARGPCIQLGRQIDSSYRDITVAGLAFQTPTNFSSNAAYAGSLIASTQRTGYTSGQSLVTITTATAHGFQTGDPVTILYTDNVAYWGDVPYITVTGTNTFTYYDECAGTSCTIILQNTPGIVALTYVAILDNAQNSKFIDLYQSVLTGSGAFNNWFDFWDDENAVIDDFNNNAYQMNHNQNWTSSYIFSGGAQNLPTGGHQLAPVITIGGSSITANYSSCASVFNSNGFYFKESVCQAASPWQFNVSNANGNFQGASFANVYGGGSDAGLNPSTPATSPWPGTGVSGLIAGYSSGAASFSYHGNGTLGNGSVDIPTFGTGSTEYIYYVVVHDTTAVTTTAALPVMFGFCGTSPSCTAGPITVSWPRVANNGDTITYDLLRMPGSYLSAANGYTTTPSYGNCTGGSVSACGYIGALGMSQCSGFVCTYTDTLGATASYSGLQSANYAGNLFFWPSLSAVTVNTAVVSDAEMSVFGAGLAISGSTEDAPAIVNYAEHCFGSINTIGGYSSCKASNQNAVTATILSEGNVGGNNWINTIGRLNFGYQYQPKEVITLADSNLPGTLGTSGYRRTALGTDVWIGFYGTTGGFSANAAPLAFNSPAAIANCIDQTPETCNGSFNGTTGYSEYLNSSGKSFYVPLVLAKTISTYNGIVTVGNGIPSEYYNTASASTNANVSATTLITAPTSVSRYRISFYVDQTVVGAGCTGTSTVTLNVIYTDPNAGAAQTVAVGTYNVATSGNGGVGNFVGQSTFNLVAKASTAVQYSTSGYTAGTGCTTHPSYQVYPVLEAQ